jgi:hypothetical protein
MNVNSSLAVALIFSPLAFVSPASASSDLIVPVVIQTQFPTACAGGYHQDRRGNCQPNNEQTNPFCPNGLVYQPEPWGWNCEAPPPGY